MAVNVQRYVAVHNRRKAKRTRMATAVGSLSLAALLTVSWGLKYIGFSLTNNQPFSLNTTVTRLDNPNPDTSVIGNNFYRQYLNVEGKEEVAPIDLLLLVDQSGSMAQNKDIIDGDNLNYRDVILSSFLNGEANADYRDNPDIVDLDQYIIDSIANEDGFVNQFLGINPDNKIAIIGLNTASDFTEADALNGNYTFFDDAQVILDWTNDPLTEKGVDVTGQYESGTDYAAGFMLADEMLNSDKVAKDGNKKVMIIISDGEPTCYTDLEGNKIELIMPDSSSEEITPAIDNIEDKLEELEISILPEGVADSQITDELVDVKDETTSTEVIDEEVAETTIPEETTTETTVETTIETTIPDETEVTIEPSETAVEEITVTEETTETTVNTEVTEETVETTVIEETVPEETVEVDITEPTEETQINEEEVIGGETVETEPSEVVIEETEVTTETTETTVEETEVVPEETTEVIETEETTEATDVVETIETTEITEATEETVVTEIVDITEETQPSEEVIVDEFIETIPTEGEVVETELVSEEDMEQMFFRGKKADTESETEATEEVIAETESQAQTSDNVEPDMSEAAEKYQLDCNEATLEAFKTLIENNKNLDVYSVGLSEDLKLTDLKENAEKYVITQLISEDGKYLYTGNNVERLGKNIFNLIEKDMPKNVVVTAELSNYVQIAPKESSEIKVTMTDSEGNITVLYDEANGGITKAGKYIVEDVVIVKPEEGDTETTGSVNLVFKPDYVLSKGNTFTMSYNVSLTSDAYEKYAAEGYTNKGDKDTDYISGAKLSSGEKGFYINRDAYITYVVNGTRIGYNVDDGVNVFNRPVVQIDEEITLEEVIESEAEVAEEVDITEIDSFPAVNDFTITGSGNVQTPDSKVVLNKNIDSLGDGQENPDTTLTGSEFYRLYLDIEGHDQSTPVDLLIVVDQSGSMFDNKDVTLNNQTVYRDVAVSAILNGSASTSRPGNPGTAETLANNKDSYWVQANATDEGLINEFLALNEKNKVCVIGFDAWRDTSEGGIRYSDKECTKQDNSNGQYMYYHGYASKGWSYKDDSTVITPWEGGNGWISGSLQNPVDVTGNWNTGTNYAAGFRLAQDMLTQQNIRNDGNQKVMIFISDGVPTCYIGSNGDRQGSTTSTLYSSSTPNEYNIMQCREPSVDAFKNLITTLHNEKIDVKAYSVGVSAELGNGDEHPYSSYSLRQCIANGGEYIYVDKDGDLLHKKLYDIINYTVPSQVVIRDQLSQYVEYYDQQPDVKVMMSKINSNEAPVVLYQNGSVTTAGKNIIQKVTYTPVKGDDTTTGTIEAIFDSTYALEPGYKYSLSYNVRLTETSYNEFVDSGYNSTGGDKSDFGTNSTSQDKGGFKSNKKAEVDFHFYGDEKTGIYDHPVVQVDETNYFTDVTVVKRWEDDKGPIKPVEPVKVQLYQVGTPVSMSIYEDFNDLNFDKNCAYKGINQSNIQLVDVDGSGNKAVHITGRESDWRGFDLKLLELRGKEVTIETNVKSSGGTVYGILFYNDGTDHYPRQFTIEGCTNEYKTGSAKITVPENATTCTVYLSTVGANDDLYIDYFNAVVPTTASLPAYVPPLADTNNATTLNENFGNTTNYSARSNDFNTTLVDADYPGNKALLITERSKGWHGISVPIPSSFVGKTINIEVRGMASEGQVQFGVQYNLNNSTEYENLSPISGSTNAYAIGSEKFTIPAGATNCSLYIQGTEGNDATSFADLKIDYVYISVEQYTPPHPDMNTSTAVYENFATDNAGAYSKRNGTETTTLDDVGELGNKALKVDDRKDTWHGILVPIPNSFAGKTIEVEVRGMANSGLVQVGLQYRPRNADSPTWTGQFNVENSTGAYASDVGTITVPNGATDLYIYIQCSEPNTYPTFYVDYIYIKEYGTTPIEPTTTVVRNPLMVLPEGVQSEATATDGPYPNGEVILSYSDNLNTHVFQNLPKWGYDENGNKLMYSYYVIEDTEGKTYESTTYSNAATPVTEGTITITNKVEGVFGFELPNTGGIGTGFNYLIGFILICIPGGFYIRRIRKRSVRDP